jgi:Fe-S-cluster containining protein
MRKGNDHDALVAEWRDKAEKQRYSSFRFLHSLKGKDGNRVDRIALEVHQEVFNVVDCTRCANCCRTLRVVVTDADVPKIAAHLGVTPQEVVGTYLERDDERGRYRMRAKPCPFLAADNKCTIYDARPEKCQGYPFTDRGDFTSHTYMHSDKTVACPAVFHVVQEMKKRV